MPRTREGTAIERLLRRIEKNTVTGCWEWTGPKRLGYGLFTDDDNSTVSVHRKMWSLCRGSIPTDREMHHTCRNKACCNPDHLLPVTDEEHRSLDKVSSRRGATHCKRGHPFEGENLHVNRKGRRVCRTCSRLAVEKFIGKDPEAYREWQNAYRKRKRDQRKNLLSDSPT